jgi:peptidoglycan/xylan/chitin deacetylase (PgdA/CDA1 family)
LKAFLSRAVSRLLYFSGTARLSRRSGACVLCYHNVVPDSMAGRVGDPWLHLAQSDFAEQIDWLARTFTIVPLGELLERLRADRSVGGLAALTFDDGYAGAVRYAVPVVRKAALPFALFPVVSAADLHRPFWWDRFGKLETTQRERYLVARQGDNDLIAPDSVPASDLPDDLMPARWDMLRQIQGDDCTIGVHTVTHRNLTTLQPVEVAWELEHARERLRQELGTVLDVVAYPYGRANETVQAEAARAGFRAGLTLDFRLVRSTGPQFNIGRINVPEGLEMVTFVCWASGLRLRDS